MRWSSRNSPTSCDAAPLAHTHGQQPGRMGQPTQGRACQSRPACRRHGGLRRQQQHAAAVHAVAAISGSLSLFRCGALFVGCRYAVPPVCHVLRCLQFACPYRLALLHDACMVPVLPADGFACHVNPMPAAVYAVSAMDASLFARYSSCVHYSTHNSPLICACLCFALCV